MLNKQEILAKARLRKAELILPTEAQRPGMNEIISEGSRNNTLFRLGCSLRSEGCTDTQIAAELTRINDKSCIPSLPQEEVESIVKSVLKTSMRGVKPTYGLNSSNAHLHVDIGTTLIESYFAKTIDGVPSIWISNRYETGWRRIRQCMNAIYPLITERQRKEVAKWLELEAPEESMGDPKYIAFNNGVLDIETMELIANASSLNIINVIPHNWNPDAFSPVLDNALNSWAQTDLDVRTNIEEVIGLAMYRGRDIVACPVLIGEGANGKSTFLKFLRDMVGTENVSSMDLATIGKRFQGTALVGKLANIGDDISSEFVNKDQASIIKKVISGDPIQVEEKYGASFSFRPYCTLIFSCNRFPRIGDDTFGMYRRFVPIPFYADFSNSSEHRNMKMEAELDREEVYEAAIVLGVKALKACLVRGEMHLNEVQGTLKEDLRIENSSVYQFCIEELGYGTSEQEDLYGEPVARLYTRYSCFCENNGCIRKNNAQFSKEIKGIFRVESARRTIDGKQQRCFINPNRST